MTPRNVLTLVFLPLAALLLDAKAGEPFTIQAKDFAVATGNPALQVWGDKTRVSVWSMSGVQTNQSIFAVTPKMPVSCDVVRIEMLVVNYGPGDSGSSAVYKVHISPLVDGQKAGFLQIGGKPVQTAVPSSAQVVRTVVLEGGLPLQYRGCAMQIRIERSPDDPGDTYTAPDGILQVRVLPLSSPFSLKIVQDCPGYNSWPFVQCIGGITVCGYSRGEGHTINKGDRGAFARMSRNDGRTWSGEVVIADDPNYGECVEGKGVDMDGAFLFWVRCFSEDYKTYKWHHDLYRSSDGMSFEKVTEQFPKANPMQITDVFRTSRGLMSLWFATSYSEEATQFWGTMTSTDNGRTWTQQIVETVHFKRDLPTEPSVVNLGNGRLLGIARTENVGDSTLTQFQLVSTDDGLTWTKLRTNIADINASTPSLVYDSGTGLVSNYYYERGRRALKRRVANADYIFDHPLEWPASECVAIGNERSPIDGGNVNACASGDGHIATFYYGTETGRCSVFTVSLPTPSKRQ